MIQPFRDRGLLSALAALSTRAALGFLLLISTLAYSAQTTLAWDPNPDPAVAGYMLYYGQASGNYTGNIDVGNVSQYTVSGLLDATTYYYAVTAYDFGRTESGFSNEVSASTASAVPLAAFSASPTSGPAPLAVTFANSSTGVINGYSWSFGDDSTSTASAPAHSYSASGTYTVSLTVTGPGGTNTVTNASYITVSAASAGPVANFTASRTSGVAPLTVAFTSTSTGSISSYSWNFGDGTTSTAANPSHAYSNAGTYSVSLTVTGSGGSNTATEANFITVSATPTPALGEIVVDNAAADIQDEARTFTGQWCKSSGTGYYGADSLYSCGSAEDTYRWSFSVLTTGAYDVYVRWSSHPYRSTTVPITVADDTGPRTETFNQQSNGGQWMLHARYNFTAGVTKYVEISDVNGLANADAVKIVPAQASTGSGLVAAYGFDEGSGASVSDRSGRGNDGVISGATWSTAGRFGKALSFNGTSSWVTVNDSASLDLTNGMTLQAWVYPTTALTGWRTVMMKEQPGAIVYYLDANSDSSVPAMGVYAGADRGLYGNAQVPANTWTHLAATYDGTTQRLYVNGVQVASRAQPGSITVSSSPLRIGGNSVWGEYFQGYIDEVRIYNRPLTTGEIQTDMNEAVTSTSN